MKIKKNSIMFKVSAMLTIGISAIMMTAVGVMAVNSNARMEEKAMQQLENRGNLVHEMMHSYNDKLRDSVERYGSLFAASFSNNFFSDGTYLYIDDERVSTTNTFVVDRFTKQAGIYASILTRKGDRFERTSTSIVDEKGERASGTFLEDDNAGVKAMLKGETYTGMVEMLGKDFMAHYIPIKDADSKVIGGFFVGEDFTKELAEFKKGLLGIKIGKTGYNWAIESDENLKLTMHPSLEGKSMKGSLDANGKDFFAEIVQNKNGRLTYAWKNPGEEVARNKIAAYTHFEPWNWIVVSGSYADEFNTDGREAAIGMILTGLALIPVVTILVMVALRRWVTKPLAEANAAIERVAHGDLSTEIKTTSNDELGSLMKATNRMIESLRVIVSDVRKAADKVSSDSESLANGSKVMSSTADEQSAVASSMAVAIEQMSQSIESIAQNAENARQISKKASEASNEGSRTIQHAIRSIHEVADVVKQASGKIESLGSSSKEINAVTDTIKEIAEQTRMLSLNAAIEAARAGDLGRGFAVVADEIRKLAEKTAKATEEIMGTSSRILSETTDAVRVMEQGVQKTSGSVELAEKADQAIVVIAKDAARSLEAISEIGAAIQEQSVAASEVSRGVENVVAMGDKNAEEARRVVDATGALKGVAESLTSSINQFRS